MLTKEQHEEAYHKILEFYDFADELISTVEHPDTKNPEAQLDFIEPMVKQIEEATDTLAEEYRNFVSTGKKPGMFTRRRIEKSLSNILDILKSCQTIVSGTNGDNRV